jgi:hypothetical protein
VRPAGLLVSALAILSAGCTGLEVAALGAAAVSAGAGSVVKAGTEYTLGGTAYRTFSVPLDDLAAVVRGALGRMQLDVEHARAVEGELVVVATGVDRTVHLRLTPITAAVTRLKLLVKQGIVRRDRATGSEIMTQIEQGVARLNSATDLL